MFVKILAIAGTLDVHVEIVGFPQGDAPGFRKADAGCVTEGVEVDPDFRGPCGDAACDLVFFVRRGCLPLRWRGVCRWQSRVGRRRGMPCGRSRCFGRSADRLRRRGWCSGRLGHRGLLSCMRTRGRIRNDCSRICMGTGKLCRCRLHIARGCPGAGAKLPRLRLTPHLSHGRAKHRRRAIVDALITPCALFADVQQDLRGLDREA